MSDSVSDLYSELVIFFFSVRSSSTLLVYLTLSTDYLFTALINS